MPMVNLSTSSRFRTLQVRLACFKDWRPAQNLSALLGCLFLSSFDNVLACFSSHISEPQLFSCSRRLTSENISNKRFESCSSAASTQNRIQRSRFSLPFCAPPLAGNSAEQTFRSVHC